MPREGSPQFRLFLASFVLILGLIGFCAEAFPVLKDGAPVSFAKFFAPVTTILVGLVMLQRPRH